MKKLVIAKVTTIAVLGASVGYALYTIKKSKKLRTERLSKILEDYERLESNTSYEEENLERTYIKLN